MGKLLRLQHWQVFIYLILIPLFFPADETGIDYYVVWGLLFVLWVIKVDEELYNRLPNGVSLNFTLLLITLFISVAYFIVIWFTVGGYNITDENYEEYGWKAWIYIPMHFFCFFSFFYALRFTAKSIACIENGKNVDLSYYGTYMAGLFFFPIGIWWIQPKINRILKRPISEFD